MPALICTVGTDCEMRSEVTKNCVAYYFDMQICEGKNCETNEHKTADRVRKPSDCNSANTKLRWCWLVFMMSLQFPTITGDSKTGCNNSTSQQHIVSPNWKSFFFLFFPETVIAEMWCQLSDVLFVPMIICLLSCGSNYKTSSSPCHGRSWGSWLRRHLLAKLTSFSHSVEWMPGLPLLFSSSLFFFFLWQIKNQPALYDRSIKFRKCSVVTK